MSTSGRLSPEPVAPFRFDKLPFSKALEGGLIVRQRWLVRLRSCPDSLGVVYEHQDGTYSAWRRREELGKFPTLYHAGEACYAADARAIFEGKQV